MPAIPAVTVEIEVPEEMKELLVDGFEGTLEVEGEVVGVSDGKVTLQITAIYPQTPMEGYIGDVVEEEG